MRTYPAALGRQQSQHPGDAKQYDKKAAAQCLRFSAPLAPTKTVLLLLQIAVAAVLASKGCKYGSHGGIRIPRAPREKERTMGVGLCPSPRSRVSK